MMTIDRRSLWRLPILLLAATLVLAFPFPNEAEAATRAERIQRNLTNADRQVGNRPRVRLHKQLSRVAKRHSRRMARRGSIYHNPRLAQNVRNDNWRILGENVGVSGHSGSIKRTLRGLQRAFMDSRPHRRNIMNRRFRQVGVGVVRSGGRAWVTVVFMG